MASTGSPSISTLLSQALVAFTIELDNEVEHRMPHRTTSHGSTAGAGGGPWLVSMVMWANCMAFVPDEGITVRELDRVARTRTNLDGMRRWGYVVLSRSGSIGAPTGPPRPDWLIRPTARGRQAQDVWRPLFGEIEERWRARFGSEEIGALRHSLEAVNVRLDPSLPDCLPILGYGLFSGSHTPGRARGAPPAGEQVTPAESASGDADGAERQGGSRLPLSALLSRVLLAFAIEFEAESNVAIAIAANVMRVLGSVAVRVRDLPDLTGVSAEAVAVTTAFLGKSGYAVEEPLPAPARGKALRLTAKGLAAQAADRQLLATIEERWGARFDADSIDKLRRALEHLAGDGGSAPSPLFAGLTPYADGWRAAVRRADVLPNYPMVLHRGGFPDGS